jgi:gamma-glutamylputrescine oxidase
MKNNLSYWEKNTFFEKVDLVIVGSGIVGLFTALEIRRKNPGWKIVVLERGILPNGASTKNAGFCCFGSLSELLDDLNHFSIEESVQLVKLRFDGLNKLRKELGDESIGYQPCGGFELFTENDNKLFEKCANNIDKYNQLFSEFIGNNIYSVDEKLIAKNGLSSNIKSIIKNSYEGSIDTGKMMFNLLKKAYLNDIIILNNCLINKFEEEEKEVRIFTNEFNFSSSQMIITTNGFARELIPEIDVQPARAQVLVTSPINDLELNGTFHYDCGYNYFRNINGRVLLGGGRNLDFKGENTTEMETTDLIQNHLEQMLREVIIPGKDFKIDYRWSGIMGVGTEKKPIIRSVRKNVFVAVRMGGMGVAIGSKIGELAAQMLSENR